MVLSFIGPHPQHIIESEVDDQLVLYDPSEETVTILNGTAADIWHLCDGTQGLDEIVATLASAYRVPIESLAAEVAETVLELRRMGCLPA